MATQSTLPEAPSGVPSPLEAEVRQLRTMQVAGQHQATLDRALPLIAQYPANRDLLLIAAIALRFLQRVDDALAMLDRLADHHPHFSQMHLERGLCHVARRDAPAAIDALRRAVAINPSLRMAWHMLDGIHRMTGDAENAAIAAAHSAHLASLPPPVVLAKIRFGDGEIEPAEMMIRRFLLDHGDHPEAMRLLAQIGFQNRVLDDAELLYTGVLAMVPDHHHAREEFVQVLIARHKFPEARAALAPLLAIDQARFDYRTHAAAIAVGLGEFEAAIDDYRAMLGEIPDSEPADRLLRADVNLWLGHALKTVGRIEEAILAYRMAIALRPDFGDAWWSLANLKTYRFGADEIAAMRDRLEHSQTGEIDRIHIAFALGKALEDAQDHAGSWVAYALGNDLHRAMNSYNPTVFETNTREQRRVCTPAFFAARSDWGVHDPAPIFVLGLPRSGSTLIEQILASHSQVEGTQELPDIQRIVHDLQGRTIDFDNPRYPAVLEDLDQAAILRFANRYLDGTRPHRLLTRPRFIDKMPNNFRHIGLIHLILPHATIIDARRNPMDCCFSNLKQLFAQGQEFTYGIENIARYYRTYLDLMRHWDAVLPGRVLRVINEDLIDDPEGQIRRMIDHCRLPFEDACLNFHATQRSVRTPSSEQVRRPVNRDGVDQWKPYAQWLERLRDTLGDALQTWRD